MSNAIELENVAISYKKVKLLHNVNLEIQTGDIVHLRGENGVGKSTFLKTVCGLKVPTSGTIKINDKVLHPGTFAPRTGILINTPRFINNLTGFENLRILANIKKEVSKLDIESYMRTFGLDPKSNTKVRSYSVGMLQKLGLIQAIMEKNNLLLLDEPLNGLDRSSKEKVLEVLERLHSENPSLTMLLVSHEDFFKNIADVFYEIDQETIIKMR
ncbi:ABC transporter ATP-binding protein [Lactobacillus sp. UCMA15818]|uniref:ATP-binding cassette domain-containing protein n=1 Tax=Lactobacillus sp. UCMA15818 TaxID=2583394 RepID=UPI0025B18F1A|nr:ABC transporter ATP-binding protein [Lactobacillus sp. UCMA15818]MDN2452800.1 ABC transporter ATP-binding protein [Lactobacillus sp. UCMA15818]